MINARVACSALVSAIGLVAGLPALGQSPIGSSAPYPHAQVRHTSGHHCSACEEATASRHGQAQGSGVRPVSFTHPIPSPQSHPRTLIPSPQGHRVYPQPQSGMSHVGSVRVDRTRPYASTPSAPMGRSVVSVPYGTPTSGSHPGMSPSSGVVQTGYGNHPSPMAPSAYAPSPTMAPNVQGPYRTIYPTSPDIVGGSSKSRHPRVLSSLLGLPSWSKFMARRRAEQEQRRMAEYYQSLQQVTELPAGAIHNR